MIVSGGRAKFLIRFFHHRWAPPALVEIARGSGARFVSLQSALSASPVSLRSALVRLRALGLIRRNPGYGHPLRPEYLPTAAGVRAAGPVSLLLGRAARLGIVDVILHKWAMPVLAAFEAGEARFSTLQDSLPGVTPRALAQTLKELAFAGLIAREILESYPPAPVYRLTPEGRKLARVLRRLGAG